MSTNRAAGGCLSASVETINPHHWGERGSLTIEWGQMAAHLVRSGDSVYATTFHGDPRWKIFRRREPGRWEPGTAGPMIRTPQLLAGPAGRLHVLCGGVLWSSAQPFDHTGLRACAIPADCGDMIYVSAAINQHGDILLVYPRLSREKQLAAALLRHDARDWQVHPIAEFPVRYCYPQIHFTQDTADVVVVEDELVADPAATWGPRQGHYYRFRRLLHLHCPRVGEDAWQTHLVHEVDDGFLHTADVQRGADGSIHALWFGWDRSVGGAAAEGHRRFVVHSVARAPGEPFQHHDLEPTGMALGGRFTPDGRGGWHYLYGRSIGTRTHRWTGQLCHQQEHVYLHASRPGAWGTRQVIDYTDHPAPITGLPHLIRPQRFGGTALADRMEWFFEAAWGSQGDEAPTRTAHYAHAPLPDGRTGQGGHRD